MNYAIALREGSTWAHELSKIIADLGTKGKLKDLEEKWWPRQTCAEDKVKNRYDPHFYYWDFALAGGNVVRAYVHVCVCVCVFMECCC